MQAISRTVAEGPGEFTSLGLSPRTLTALRQAGFIRPSPVQAALIPPAMAGRDCIGNAPTGTGKTASFLLPILERLDERRVEPQALILAPTRELAHQIRSEFERLSHGRSVQATVVVGGESMNRQIQSLSRGCHLIIATPGRLIDLMRRGVIRLRDMRMVVLDEADRMLDIGFRPDVERILESMPRDRQTLLLSATLPKGVRELASRFLKNPVDVRLIHEREDATVATIRQSFVMVQHDRKLDLLAQLLTRENPGRAIVFCRTRRGADKLGRFLRQGGFRVESLHGNLTQSRRNRVLQGFRDGRVSTLVATDVVGRGIDVPGITHVVNYDLPEDPENYVHRVGRTGRMGRDGVAYSFVSPEQGPMLDAIEKAISRVLDVHEVEGFSHPPRPSTAPRQGRSTGNRMALGRTSSTKPKGRERTSGQSPARASFGFAGKSASRSRFRVAKPARVRKHSRESSSAG